LRCRLEEHFHKTFHVLTIDVLHVSTDSLRSTTTEFEPPPEDSRALVTEQSGVASEIPENISSLPPECAACEGQS
jgi:hypothetical protein